MMFLYRVLFFFFALFYLPRFLAAGKHREGFGERLGLVPEAAVRRLAGFRRRIWVHAVSVGEIVQGMRLGEALRRSVPECGLVYTTNTRAGRDTALRLKKEGDEVFYVPADFRSSARRFLDRVKPDMAVVLETEIWPNLIHELSARRIPLVLANGRISDRALGAYRRVRFFLAPLLKRMERILVQDDGMRARFIELGADPSRVAVTGSMKYDWIPQQCDERTADGLQAPLRPEGAFLVIAGSTHEGEEEMLFDLYGSLRGRHPGLRFLVAPRHLDRIASVQKAAERRGIAPVRVSRFLERNGSAPEGRSRESSVYLLDRMGLLGAAYRLADLVFIGGSLVPCGGHNPVEAAFFEKPILFGPHMDNFREMVEKMKKEGAGLEVAAGSFASSVHSLITDAAERRRMGEAAKRWAASHTGATDRNAGIIAEILRKSGPRG